jgi:hypothetical protein
MISVSRLITSLCPAISLNRIVYLFKLANIQIKYYIHEKKWFAYQVFGTEETEKRHPSRSEKGEKKSGENQHLLKVLLRYFFGEKRRNTEEVPKKRQRKEGVDILKTAIGYQLFSFCSFTFLREQ